MAFAQAMLKPDLPNAEKAIALRAAVEEHKNYAQKAGFMLLPVKCNVTCGDMHFMDFENCHST